MKGPFRSEEEVTSWLGTTAWSLSPRFALQREEPKVCVIDGFKMSAVNKAFA